MTAPAGFEAAPPPSRRRRGVVIGLAVALVIGLTALAAYRWGATGIPQAAPTPSATPRAAEELTTAEIFSVLAASVVSIESTTGGATAEGTGVIVNVRGTILTALHVVEGAESITVTFVDGTSSPATIAGADPASDIAALDIATPPEVIVPAVLGGGARIGDNVVAIGNQLGLTDSTTAGVVSGLNRSATGDDGTKLSGLIQFDAAVNPGSSGGPLVNTRGETIGIVVALANPTDARTFIGIGFAVPIGMAVAGGGGDRQPQR
jgi:S1-C subfamily serine protease